MSRLWVSVLVLAHATLSGCQRTPGEIHGNVAVVDLDEVAQQLGLSEQCTAELSAKQSLVKQKLVGYQQLLSQQLKTKKGEVVAASGTDAPLPESQLTQLASYQQELNEKFRLAQSEAKEHLTKERSRIILNFRRQAEQICSEVAQQKGYDVVLTKNETVVLTFAPHADITKAVAEQLRIRLAGSSKAARSMPSPLQR